MQIHLYSMGAAPTNPLAVLPLWIAEEQDGGEEVKHNALRPTQSQRQNMP